MAAILHFLYGLGLIAIVVGIFNIIIFVHELGHFLAARWRGLQVDRFQIWFGKPIWKKEINGVQYGLGWIPAGGFVALPQMAPMESIEGTNRDDEEDEKPLPPVKPIDKIIVAFAGPLFSFLLALTAGLLVWKVGRPKDFVESQVIGYVQLGSKAEEAGLRVGDKIIAVNGKPVNGFQGSPSLDSIQESVMLSEGEQIAFTVERPGEGTVEIRAGFKIPKTHWAERKGLRQVGIWTENKTIFGMISKGGPAERAGLKKGDVVISANGEVLTSNRRFGEIVDATNGKELSLVIERDGVRLPEPVVVVPEIPKNLPEGQQRAMIGVGWGNTGEYTMAPYYPDPFTQVGDSLRMMWVTVAKIASPDSSVGLEHLSGPVGIGGAMFDILRTPDGWKRLLWFMVLFNVNLAVLNMLPLPVLDGGHIVLATGEMIAGRPVKARFLEVVQTVFALVLLCFFLFITFKDIGDRLGIGGEGGPEELEWSTPTEGT